MFSTYPSAAFLDDSGDQDAKETSYTAFPSNQRGCQSEELQPNLGSTLLSRLVWKLRWGTTFETSRYYKRVVTRGLLSDTTKREFLKHVTQHVDKELVPTLFPGLESLAAYHETTATITELTRNDVLCSRDLKTHPQEYEGYGQHSSIVFFFDLVMLVLLLTSPPFYLPEMLAFGQW